MWCGTCHQDVPGVANSGRLTCPRCQQSISRRSAVDMPAICDDGIALDEPAAAAVAARPPVRPDDWVTKRRARELDRKLRKPLHLSSSALANANFTNTTSRRFDAAQSVFTHIDQFAIPAVASSNPSPSSAIPLAARHSVASQVFAWLVVATGVIVFLSGAGLLGWSVTVKQFQYWNIAIGLTLGGQGALILGLVLVVSRLWRNSRYAVNKLQEVHARLAQLQSTADALAGARTAGAPAFYAELVRGASPQMLLGNLKGQLDQLAARLDR